MVSFTIAMQSFVSVDEILKLILIQIKATEQYFPVVLFITLYMYRVVLTFESVDEIPKLIIQIKVPEYHFCVVLFITYTF